MYLLYEVSTLLPGSKGTSKDVETVWTVFSPVQVRPLAKLALKLSHICWETAFTLTKREKLFKSVCRINVCTPFEKR